MLSVVRFNKTYAKNMEAINKLILNIPPEAKDLEVNLQRVLNGTLLNTEQTWGSALASAYFIRHPYLCAAVLADAEAAGLSAAALADAKAAAAIMGMNTIYFRFRHLMDSEAYNQQPFNLRMSRMQQVATTKLNFELFSIGPAALAGCELCLKAHETAIKKDGLNETHIHDVVRIASVLNGIAVAYDTVFQA
jgi:alkyl hydroperoxide reductase subunit D